MKLDLGGIAKGYAGDCAIQTLREHGIASALFEAGGDIVVSGAPPGTEGWLVEFEDAGAEMPKEMRVKDCAVSTSGDTVQFVEIGGKHYSHVVDPRTGMGVTTRLMGTVVAPKGVWADPLSKSVYLIGEGERGELLKHYPGVRAYVREVVSSRNATRAPGAQE
jgi:thiamine biosynthesis lipoprotein